jgi:predicted secreted protein
MMRWTSALAIYILFWAFSVFLVLPFGVRTSSEAGAEHVPGTAESSPHEFRPWLIARRVTIVATVLFLLFQLNYIYDWISPASLDLWNMQGTTQSG